MAMEANGPPDGELVRHDPAGDVAVQEIAEVIVVETTAGHLEEILEVVEIEIFAPTGKIKPRGKKYAFRVGKHRYEVEDPIITGREILKIAGKLPPENYTLRQILHGGEIKVIELDQKVDLRAPHVERFRAMPRNAQDGR